MGLKPFHGLEMAEIGLLGLTALGVIVAIASGQWLWGAIALWLTLALNIFNRLRGEWLTRQQIRSLKHQQRQILDEKLNIRRPEASPPSIDSTTTASAKEIQALKQAVARLEQSLSQVWQGLQQTSPVDRHEKQEIVLNQPEGSFSVAHALPKTDPAPLLPKKNASLMAVSWQPGRLLREHLDRVSALSLSEDGRYFASGSWDQTLKLWDLKEGHCLRTINAHDQGIKAVVFVGDRKIATGSYDQNLKIWSLEEKHPQDVHLHLEATLTTHTGSIHALGVASAGKLLVSGSYDQMIKRWDMEKEEFLSSSYDSSGAIAAIALDPHDQWIASAGGDGEVTLWQMTGSAKTDNTKIMTLSGNVSSVDSLAVSPDGQTLAAGCGDGTIKIWTIPDSASLPPGKLLPVRTLTAHIGQVTCLCFSLEAPLLYSAGVDGVIKLWHPGQQEAIAQLTFPLSEPSRRRGVFSLILTPDGQTLLAGGDNGTIQLWTKD